LLLGASAAVSGGPLGGGRLAEIGPVPWQVAGVATVVIAAGALLSAAATKVLARPAGAEPGARRPAAPRR
ncbi:hypothetical protein DLJ46_28930, partial [Micromonospora globispora]